MKTLEGFNLELKKAIAYLNAMEKTGNQGTKEDCANVKMHLENINNEVREVLEFQISGQNELPTDIDILHNARLASDNSGEKYMWEMGAIWMRDQVQPQPIEPKEDEKDFTCKQCGSDDEDECMSAKECSYTPVNP